MALTKWGGFIIGVVMILQGIHTVDAAQTESRIKVGISPFSPFVILEREKPIGAAIDHWRLLALRMDVDYEFVECAGVADKLNRLKAGQIDIAIGGITVTAEREALYDFTHSTINTGLDILTLRSDTPSLLSFFSALFTKNKLMVMAGVLLLIVMAGHIIWLVERTSKKTTTTFSHKYFPGVFEGMYWALITASTIGYGDKVPKRWIGRILAGILIIIFLPIFGYFIAQLSSDLTVQSLKHNINGPEDLAGRRVAVVKGTTSEKYMEEQRSYLYTYESAAWRYSGLY